MYKQTKRTMSMKYERSDFGGELLSLGSPISSLGEFFGRLADQFKAIGAEHSLITGLPLPGKDLSKLILHRDWAEGPGQENLLPYIQGDDPLLRRIAASTRPKRWSLSNPDNAWLYESSLIKLMRQSRQSENSYRELIGIHVHSFDQLQIAICLAGHSLTIKERDLVDLCTSVQFALDHLHAIEPVLRTRPGELSSRERMVLSLTAQGKTASDIATELSISQRTVHAHLQNASEKMRASNKTQTVVEAVRYGQIQLL